MNSEDSLLLETPDDRLNPHALARKKLLQNRIVARRKVTAPLLDGSRQADFQNRFDRRDKSLGERLEREAEANAAAATKRKEDAQDRWRQTTSPRTSAGTLSTPQLEARRRESDASRAASRRPPRVIDTATLGDLVWACAVRHSEISWWGEFNKESFNRAVQWQLGHGAEVSSETVEAAFQNCIAGNHFEFPHTKDEQGNHVRKRGDVFLQPPTLHPPFVWSDERQILADGEQQLLVEMNSQEAQQALAMPFETLKKLVYQGFKSTAAGIENVGERIR